MCKEESSAGAANISDDLHGRALSVLQETLQREKYWLKVHAAEFLVALHRGDGVAAAFNAELAAHGQEPKYRIGIWRVLARTAPSDHDRAGWIDKIRGAALDAAAEDRIHALETLAKLEYRVSDQEAARLSEAARPDSGAAAAYARWLLANSGRPEAVARLVELLASADARTRGIAGYALRHRRTISAEALERLLAAAEREPADSPARVMLVGAAAVHAAGRQKQAFHEKLLQLAASGTNVEKAQAAQALALLGEGQDTGRLADLLTAANVDVRAAAAYAILQIGRGGNSAETAPPDSPPARTKL